MKEAEIEKRVMAYATVKGVLQYKFVSPNTRGVPDRILFYKGRTLFIEFKKQGEKPSRLQEIQMIKLEAAGMRVAVVNGVSLGEMVIDKFVYGADKV